VAGLQIPMPTVYDVPYGTAPRSRASAPRPGTGAALRRRGTVLWRRAAVPQRCVVAQHTVHDWSHFVGHVEHGYSHSRSQRHIVSAGYASPGRCGPGEIASGGRSKQPPRVSAASDALHAAADFHFRRCTQRHWVHFKRVGVFKKPVPAIGLPSIATRAQERWASK
jgi:hypothetical protein